MYVSLAAVTYALRSLSQLITYFLFTKSDLKVEQLDMKVSVLGQSWNLFVYQIKNVEVRICRFKL